MARPNYPDPDSERERGKELKQEKERLYDQREEDDIDAGHRAAQREHDEEMERLYGNRFPKKDRPAR